MSLPQRDHQTSSAAVGPESVRPGIKVCFAALLVLVTMAGLEVLSRAYWVVREGLPVVVRAEHVWRSFFPEWAASGVESLPAPPSERTFDVLLLGGSALVDGFGNIASRLERALATRLQRPVRIINLAFLGRTTRDSRIKYEKLAGPRFDVVMVYHGINDTYLNNTPAHAFRMDYTHANRFRHLAALEQHREFPLFAFPYTARYLGTNLLDRLLLSNRPRREWHAYGAELKTPTAFEDNLDRIATLARQRGDRLVLMTFAYHIPSNYTEEAFVARALDYGAHISPIKLWGTPGNVARAIDAHNEAVRRVVARHPEALLVDQRRLMPVGKAYFNDVCHLTETGADRFVANILASIELDSPGTAGRK